MNHLQANLCLLCVTFCWSSEVIIFSCIPDEVSPFATTCITFLAGGGLLLLAFFKRIRESLSSNMKKIMVRCIILSVMNGAFNTMYQFGLKNFDVSTGAFTLSLTVVALPIILLIQHSRIARRSWISSALVLAGICIALCKQLSIEQIPGLLIISAGCILRAFYIVKLNQYAKEHDPIVLTTLICLIGGIIYYFVWMGVQPSTFFGLAWSSITIASLAIYSYFVVALTITLNVCAQRYASATNATIIYSLEIVFTVIWGLILPASLIDKVQITPFIIIGIICVVLGNLVEIIDVKTIRKNKKGESA